MIGRALLIGSVALSVMFPSQLRSEGLLLTEFMVDNSTTLQDDDVGYPEQQADVSYGMATDSNSSSSIVDGAPVRVLVPPGPDLGLQWTQLDFDDGSWKEGTTGVGYGGPSPALTPLGTDVKAEMQN